jgi:hypothetical protein
MQCSEASTALHIVFNQATVRQFPELRSGIIAWAWCVPEKRELTQEEI